MLAQRAESGPGSFHELVWAPPVLVEAVAGAAASGRPTTRYGYDAVGNRVDVVDPRGNRTTTSYDRLDRRARVDFPAYTPPGAGALQPFESYGYDKVGNLVVLVNRRNQTTNYSFDGRNRVVRQLDPLVGGAASRGATLRSYDDAGNETSLSDPTGAVVTAGHDQLGRLRTTTAVVRQDAPAGSFTTTSDYDDLGNETLVVDPGGVAETRLYDAASQLLATTDALGNTTTFAYDVAGRRTAEQDPLGRRAEHVYDLAGRETATVSKDAATASVLATTYQDHDAAGNVVGRRSARSSGPADSTFLTSFAFDALNRLTSRTEPGSGTAFTTTYGYDANTNLTRLSDGRGNSTAYTWNPWDLPASTVEPSTPSYPAPADRTYARSYDGGGLATGESQPGVSVARSFDELGRLRTETGSGPGLVTATRSFGYDLAGRRSSFSHPSGTVTLATDDRGLVLSASVPGSAATASSFRYDPAGRMTSRTDAAGTSTFAYTGRGELDIASDPLTGLSTDFDWNDAGQVSTISYATAPAASRTFAYDPSGRLESDTLRTGSAVASAQGYAYDPAGNVTATTFTMPGNAAAGTHAYTYDRSDRLATWTRPGGARMAYTYDAAGNRTTAGATTSTYDARNRLTTDGTTTYAWSARGTLGATTVRKKSTPVTFDALGRQSGRGTTTYTYDALDRVATRATSAFAYAGTEADPVAYGTERYARTPSGDLTALRKATTSRLVGQNRHGDVAWLLGPTGAVSDTRIWDPYGQVAGASGSTAPSLGFQSDWTDPTTASVNMGARWYQPGTATFTARDTDFGELGSPITLNRYTYANGDPLGFFDPDGRRGICLGCALKAVTSLPGAVVGAGGTVIRKGGELAGGVGATAMQWGSAAYQGTRSVVATAGRTMAAAPGAMKRQAVEVVRQTARGVGAAARTVGQAAVATVNACAGSDACRTAAVGVAVAATALACAACAVGAAIGAGIGGGVGVATCGGDPACVARSAITGAAGGVAAPIGGFWTGAALSGLSGGLAGQSIAGRYDLGALQRDVGMSLATAGALRSGGQALRSGAASGRRALAAMETRIARNQVGAARLPGFGRGAPQTAVRGGAGPVRVGQQGLDAVGVTQNTARIALPGGRYRVPDILDEAGGVIGEVKNVQSLSYTSQLRDYASYAQGNGLQFDLYVRGSTRLSGPLQRAVDDGFINLFRPL